MNIDLAEFELGVHQRNSQGLTQPITSIYSKSDGVVGWQACVDTYNQHAINLEVAWVYTCMLGHQPFKFFVL